MRDEDIYESRDNPDHGGGIYTAVRVWFADPSAAKAKYGPIASWDISEVTNVHGLFYNKEVRKKFSQTNRKKVKDFITQRVCRVLSTRSSQASVNTSLLKVRDRNEKSKVVWYV